MLETKQKLADSGIIFDTISLSIGEDSDCWPYIIDIEKLPYTVFSQPDFSRQIMEVHLKDNPQWSLAFRYISDRYDNLIKTVDWQQADSFEIGNISGKLNMDYNLQDSVYGNIMYLSTDGVGVDDIDVINYICNELGNKLEVIEMSFDGIITALKSGKVDVSGCSIIVTEERKKSVLFSEPNYSGGIVVVTRR